MQKALESFFGPELLGLLGLGFMLIMFVPKLIRHWRGKQSHKKDPNNERARILGLRSIQAETQDSAAQAAAHSEHGEAVAILRADIKTILLTFLLWELPIVVILLAVPSSQQSLFTILMVPAVLFACIGVLHLMHLADRATFYRTGVIIRDRLNSQTIDYNAICKVTMRKPLFAWMAPSYILHLEDDKIAVLDGTNYVQGKSQLKLLLDSLGERVIRSAADEASRK